MHAHTVDWLRNVEISADAALADKRWKTAEDYAGNITGSQLTKLLRVFLFPKPPKEIVSELTADLLKIDPEFPVTGNVESVRLMAGLVMATTFEENSSEADAFALGIRAARLLGTRGQPAVAGIVEEAEGYLARETARQRPDDFADKQESYAAKLTKKYDAMVAAQTSGEADKAQKARQSYHEAVADHAIGRRMRQLAEECQLLWLVVGEYSPSLKEQTSKLSAACYSLVSAAEAASRVAIIPPPPSINAILTRALAPCKDGRKKVSLAELLNACDAEWRAARVTATSLGESRALLPLCSALEKMEELGDAAHASAAVLKICPCMKGELKLTPDEASQQFFAELSFLAALQVL